MSPANAFIKKGRLARAGCRPDFNVFDGFRSQNPPGRANIRLERRSGGAQFQAVEYRQECQAGTPLADFPT
jgi:hypothetical protein